MNMKLSENLKQLLQFFRLWNKWSIEGNWSPIEVEAKGPYAISWEMFKWCNLNIILGFIKTLLKNHTNSLWVIWNHCQISQQNRQLKRNNIAYNITETCIMILKETCHKSDPYLNPYQNGFRSYRSTTYCISVPRRITGAKPNNLRALLTLFEFRKAFDSIHCDWILYILQACDIVVKLIDSFSLMYKNARRHALRVDRNLGFFEIVADIFECNTPATYLCVLCWTMQCIKQYKKEKWKLGSNLIREEVDIKIQQL